jgi:hypothetical protein
MVHTVAAAGFIGVLAQKILLQKGNKLQWDGTPRGRNCNNFFRQLSLRKRKDPGKNPYRPSGECKAKANHCQMDEGGKRAVAIMTAILTAMHMRTAGDWFGTPSGGPETDKLIAASVQ